MVTDSPISGYTVTRAPTWTVPSRTRHGRDHVVTQVTDDGVLFCSCEAGQYGRSCWHREWVKDGRAGKPRIAIRPKPANIRTPEVPEFQRPEVVSRPAFDDTDLWGDGGAAVARSVASMRQAVVS